MNTCHRKTSSGYKRRTGKSTDRSVVQKQKIRQAFLQDKLDLTAWTSFTDKCVLIAAVTADTESSRFAFPSQVMFIFFSNVFLLSQ
ncbi:MAG: hypothetical protein LBV80_02010 [Deltaproteobacteria bacterium]|nr:hypothetical protein [Deltaproteobacteria bacterium]